VVVIAIAAAMVPTLLPASDQIGVDGRRVAAGVIFIGSYLALAIGRIPGLSMGNDLPPPSLTSGTQSTRSYPG
jgi:hypothetical protein